MTVNKLVKQKDKLEDQLTLKQRKWLQLYLQTGNATQAAMQSYDVKDKLSAQQLGFENVRKLKSPISLFMEKHGLTLDKLVDKLAEGLDASRSIPVPNRFGPPDVVEIPDHLARHRYLETAGRWLGLGSEQQIQQTNIQVNIPILGKEELYVPEDNSDK